jgi:DNA-binding NarL/FixJ family response regulator
MPEISGLEVARRLRASGSRAKIVFVTVHEDPDFICEALHVGASGYIAKGVMASDLRQAVHAVMMGRKFISPSLGFSTPGHSKH